MPIFRMAQPGRFVHFEKTPFQEVEKVLEDWIQANPHLLLEDERIAIFSRQPKTAYGKFPDLLGVDVAGACVVVELKRGQAPRDVIAQALEYAAWVDSRDLSELDNLAREYALHYNTGTETLADVYRQAFIEVSSDTPGEVSQVIDHVTFNNQQRVVIVAENFLPETEQTLRYLRTKLGVDITGLQFGVHRAGEETLVQTDIVVGRESVANGFAKSPPSGAPAATESDESIAARVRTPFMKQAVRTIEAWIEDLDDSNVELWHGAHSYHYIRIRGKNQIYYQYKKAWLSFVLYEASTSEAQELSSRLSKPGEIRENSDGTRFYVVTQDDLQVVKDIVRARLDRLSGDSSEPASWS